MLLSFCAIDLYSSKSYIIHYWKNNSIFSKISQYSRKNTKYKKFSYWVFWFNIELLFEWVIWPQRLRACICTKKELNVLSIPKHLIALEVSVSPKNEIRNWVLLEGWWYKGRIVYQIWAEWAKFVNCYLQKDWISDFIFGPLML